MELAGRFSIVLRDGVHADIAISPVSEKPFEIRKRILARRAGDLEERKQHWTAVRYAGERSTRTVEILKLEIRSLLSRHQHPILFARRHRSHLIEQLLGRDEQRIPHGGEWRRI